MLIHRGRRFELHEVQIPAAGGDVVGREMIVHPGSVVVLPLLGDGRAVLIRNHRFTAGRELLELVAGTLEPPEPPEACALRELREEAGYDAARIAPLGCFHLAPGTSTEVMYAFVAEGLIDVGQQLEPTERIRVECFTLARLREMLVHGEFEDAKTMAVLGMWLLRHDRDGDAGTVA